MTATKRSVRGVLVGLFVAAIVIAGGLSYYASSSPDGLEKVAADKGLDVNERAHSIEDSPLAGYSVNGVGSDRASVGIAGIIGVIAVGAVGAGVFIIIARRGGKPTRQATDIGA